MKILIFADFMYKCIVIVENTQAQYFDNLIRKLYASVLKNDNTVMHQVCQYARINALFLATFSEPILVFVRITKWKTTTIYQFERVLFTITHSLFHSLLWHRFSPLFKSYTFSLGCLWILCKRPVTLGFYLLPAVLWKTLFMSLRLFVG